MTKENINNTLEKKESSFGFKTQLAALFTVLSIQYGIAQTNTVNSDITTKAKTEIVTNEILSPEKILEKHNITDIKTATIEKLKNCYKELDGLLRGPTAKITGEARKPYITLRGQIGDRIEDIELEAETKKLDEKVRISTEILESLRGKKKE